MFHFILDDPALTDKCRGSFFSIAVLKAVFDVVKPFVLSYKTKPEPQQVMELIANSPDISPENKQQLTVEIVEQIWQTQMYLGEYDTDWMTKTVQSWLRFATLMGGTMNLIEYIKMMQGTVTVENCEEVCQKAMNIFTTGVMVDFNDNSEGTDFYNPKSHQTRKLKRFPTGYDFIDRGSKGGYWPGSLWVFLGAPKAGKSRWLQNLCAQSVRKGYDTAYITLELQEEIVTQRIGSNLLEIPMDDYDRVASDEQVMAQKIKQFATGGFTDPGMLRIKEFPTSTLSVNDLEAWLLKEEERMSSSLGRPFKFKLIYLDYLNIMKNWRNPNSENMYLKIKQIAEDLRAIAMKNGWCIVTVTQVKLAFFNAADVDMTAASESSALQATVDMMYGIISDPVMQVERCQYMKCLLTRVSPFFNERKRYNIDDTYMRMSEDPKEGIKKDEDFIQDTVNNINKVQSGQGYKRKTTRIQQNVPADIPQAPPVGAQPSLSTTELETINLFK